MITFEEFKEEVFPIYLRLTIAFEEADTKRYFRSDEAEQVLKSSYREYVDGLESGELTTAHFHDAAAGCAYCLSLMY